MFARYSTSSSFFSHSSFIIHHHHHSFVSGSTNFLNVEGILTLSGVSVSSDRRKLRFSFSLMERPHFFDLLNEAEPSQGLLVSVFVSPLSQCLRASSVWNPRQDLLFLFVSLSHNFSFSFSSLSFFQIPFNCFQFSLLIIY